MWNCKKCNESLEDQYDSCRKCGTDKHGKKAEVETMNSLKTL